MNNAKRFHPFSGAAGRRSPILWRELGGELLLLFLLFAQICPAQQDECYTIGFDAGKNVYAQGETCLSSNKYEQAISLFNKAKDHFVSTKENCRNPDAATLNEWIKKCDNAAQSAENIVREKADADRAAREKADKSRLQSAESSMSLSQFLSAQGELEKKATGTFSKYLNTGTQNSFLKSALPSFSECEMIFQSKADAMAAYKYCEEAKIRYFGGDDEKVEYYKDCRVNIWIIDKASGELSNDEYITGGEEDILSKFKAGIPFYSVEYFEDYGDDADMRYNSFVYLNNRFVFLPKIWRAFR
jgi:hypothetical protein